MEDMNREEGAKTFTHISYAFIGKPELFNLKR